jgi:predicted dehydrogenase
MQIGIIGLDSNVAQNIEKIRSVSEFELIGLYDHNATLALKTAKQFSINYFNNPADLIAQSSIIDFSAPHPMDIHHAGMAIRSARHLFLENNFLQNSTQAHKLMSLAEEAKVKVQVSRSDRFNIVVTKARPYINQPGFIEIRRTLSINRSRNDFEIIMQLLLQDIDLILSFVNSEVKRIQTRTNYVFSNKAELINTRIEFDNGCVASFNINSLSNINTRKIAFYQENSVINIDLIEQKLEVLSSEHEANQSISKSFVHDNISVNPTKSEMESFSRCILQNTSPVVGLCDASQSLLILEEIREQISVPNQ